MVIPTSGSWASSRYDPYAFGMLCVSANFFAFSKLLADTATTACSSLERASVASTKSHEINPALMIPHRKGAILNRLARNTVGQSFLDRSYFENVTFKVDGRQTRWENVLRQLVYWNWNALGLCNYNTTTFQAILPFRV